MPEAPYAWAGSVAAFLGTPEEDVLRRLTRFARETGAPQMFAWDRSVGALRQELGRALPDAAGFGLVLEFELQFGCQSLELDLPILSWGPDLYWDGSGWSAKVGRPRYVKNPQRLRLNAYRVLLTRGREGVTIFVPPEPSAVMDPCFEALRVGGFETLI